MSTYTSNLGLTKPSADEYIDIDVINVNMDKIDNALNTTFFINSFSGVNKDILILARNVCKAGTTVVQMGMGAEPIFLNYSMAIVVKSNAGDRITIMSAQSGTGVLYTNVWADDTWSGWQAAECTTEKGTSNGWTYKKYADGTAEAWCAVLDNNRFEYCNRTEEGYARGWISQSNQISFPFTFKEKPYISVDARGYQNEFILSAVSDSTTSYCIISSIIMSADEGKTVDGVRLCIQIKGRWK